MMLESVTLYAAMFSSFRCAPRDLLSDALTIRSACYRGFNTSVGTHSAANNMDGREVGVVDVAIT
jgi:hypothetical protein